MDDGIREGLAFIGALEPRERRAFLALFAGARFPWHCHDGKRPTMGKAECEWVEDWRDFYGKRLVEAGLFGFEEGGPHDLPGMVRNDDGSMRTGTTIVCGPTPLGYSVRDAWWNASCP